MTLAGHVALSSSNRRSSIRVALFEKTLKLTPPGQTVAPRGALAPAATKWSPICSMVMPALLAAVGAPSP
jgi:hypothetical protein